MTPSKERKKILFVGASGNVASRIIPFLSQTYDVVGISRARSDLRAQCVAFYLGDIEREYERIFTTVFAEHLFDAIIWNPVLYVPQNILDATRNTLHREFDLAIALPLECLRAALPYTMHRSAHTLVFILVSSGLAFGQKPTWGSYSIVKRGQVILAEYLAQESHEYIHTKVVTLGAIAETPRTVLEVIFTQALEENDETKVLYRIVGTGSDCKIV